MPSLTISAKGYQYASHRLVSRGDSNGHLSRAEGGGGSVRPANGCMTIDVYFLLDGVLGYDRRLPAIRPVPIHLGTLEPAAKTRVELFGGKNYTQRQIGASAFIRDDGARLGGSFTRLRLLVSV